MEADDENRIRIRRAPTHTRGKQCDQIPASSLTPHDHQGRASLYENGVGKSRDVVLRMRQMICAGPRFKESTPTTLDLRAKFLHMWYDHVPPGGSVSMTRLRKY